MTTSIGIWYNRLHLRHHLHVVTFDFAVICQQVVHVSSNQWNPMLSTCTYNMLEKKELKSGSLPCLKLTNAVSHAF